VENLWAPTAGDAVVDLSTIPFPLKHLHTTFIPIFHDIPLTNPLFSQLTHLGLIWSAAKPTKNVDIASKLSLLPRLTHVSFNAGALIPSCDSILQNCQSLSVLVSLDIDELDNTFYEYFVHTLSKDLRFVVMDYSWFQDWQSGVHTVVSDTATFSFDSGSNI
jgi:hypothetical protein